MSFKSIFNWLAIDSNAIPFCASECVISRFPREDDETAKLGIAESSAQWRLFSLNRD